MRSMLAGVAKTGSETAQRLEGFASVRSTLAGVAETGLNLPPLCKGRGTTEWWKGCKNNPSPPTARTAFFRSSLAGGVMLQLCYKTRKTLEILSAIMYHNNARIAP